MFVSHQFKLLFFEVPRTGSRSASKALAMLDPDSITAVKRANETQAYSYHLYETKTVADHPDYRLIAAHRNPYERLYSHYKYRSRIGNPDFLKTLSFAEYVQWMCDPKSRPDLVGANLDTPIVEMLPVDRVDFWLSFDSLNADWVALSAFLNIKLPAIPKINASMPSEIERPFSRELAAQVEHRFKADFDYFGYSVDSWSTVT
mgnify:CR=1 FL=1